MSTSGHAGDDPSRRRDLESFISHTETEYKNNVSLMSPLTIETKERNIHINNIIKLNDDDINISGYIGTDNLDVENIHIDNLYFDGDTLKVYKINNPRMENGFPSRDPGFLYIYNRYKRKRLSKMYIPNHGNLFYNPINWYVDKLPDKKSNAGNHDVDLENIYDRYSNRFFLYKVYNYAYGAGDYKIVETDSSMYISPNNQWPYGNYITPNNDQQVRFYNSSILQTSIVIEDPDVVTQVYKTKNKSFIRTNLTKDRKNRWRNLNHNEYLSPVENIFKKSWKHTLIVPDAMAGHHSYDFSQDYYANEIIFKITSFNGKTLDGFNYKNNILPVIPVDIDDRGVITSYTKDNKRLQENQYASYNLFPQYKVWTERGVFLVDNIPEHFKARNKFNLEDNLLDDYLKSLNIIQNGHYRPVSLYQPLIEEYMKWGNTLDEDGETYVVLPKKLEIRFEEDSRGKYIEYAFAKIKSDPDNLTHRLLGNKTLIYNPDTKKIQPSDKTEVISTGNKAYLSELNDLYPELPSMVGNETLELYKNTDLRGRPYVHLDNLISHTDDANYYRKGTVTGIDRRDSQDEKYFKGLEFMYKLTYYHFTKVASPELKSLFGEGLRKMALFNKVHNDKNLENPNFFEYVRNMKKFSVEDFINPNNIDYEKLMNNPKKLHFMDMMKNGFDGNNSDDPDKKMKWSQWTKVYYPNSDRHKYSDDGWEHEVNSLDIASYYMENLNINNLEKKITSKKTRDIENVFYGIFGNQGVKNIHTFDEALFKPGYFYVPHDRLGSGVNYQKGSFFTPTNNNKLILDGTEIMNFKIDDVNESITEMKNDDGVIFFHGKREFINDGKGRFYNTIYDTDNHKFRYSEVRNNKVKISDEKLFKEIIEDQFNLLNSAHSLYSDLGFIDAIDWEKDSVREIVINREGEEPTWRDNGVINVEVSSWKEDSKYIFIRGTEQKGRPSENGENNKVLYLDTYKVLERDGKGITKIAVKHNKINRFMDITGFTVNGHLSDDEYLNKSIDMDRDTLRKSRFTYRLDENVYDNLGHLFYNIEDYDIEDGGGGSRRP